MTKAAASKSWTLFEWASGVRASYPQPVTGLDFPSNFSGTGSDVRLIWDGANLLPRYPHTAIWRIRYKPQVGYYAVTWHVQHDRTFNGYYAFGVHPYPCDGTYNVSGGQTGGLGGSGTEHYMEVAGLGQGDWIAIPMEPAFLINNASEGTGPAQTDTWLTQARTSYLDGSNLIHRAWPDVENAPNDYIERVVNIANLNIPDNPAFYIGGSDWTGDGDTNSECPSGIIRGIRLFSAALSIAEIQQEAAAIGNNTAASTTGQANTWYINDDPTPDDVTDKSGEGHHPTWGTAHRPALWVQ